MNRKTTPFVEKSDWNGHEIIKFGAGTYEATLVPELGGSLVSLVEKSTGSEILHAPGDFETFSRRPRIYGIPVIFPPNRIRYGKFRTRHRDYSLPINSSDGHHCHGIIGLKPWTIEGTSQTSGTASVAVCYRNDPAQEFYTAYPHTFTFTNTYEIDATGLTQTFRIKNKDSLPIPVGVGFHTAFRIPFHPRGRRENIRLRLSVGNRWEIDGRTIPTERLVTLSEVEENYRNGGLPAAGFSIRDHYRAEPIDLEGKAVNAAVLEDHGTGYRVIYEAGPLFKHWMVWNDLGDKSYICPEPMTWTIDAPNLNLPRETTGYRLLDPGEILEDQLSIKLRPIKEEKTNG